MDPLANMLNALKQASTQGHTMIEIPYSRLKAQIAKVLFEKKYLASYAKKARKKGDVLALELPTGPGVLKIHTIRRISKPSRRMYTGVKHIRPVKNGFGLLVLSTPKGVLSADQAKQEQVGGEMLFELW